MSQEFAVIQKNNFTQKDIPLIITEIKNQSFVSSVFVFYYSGLAAQLNEENYLLPIDADVNNELDVKTQSLKFSDVVEASKSIVKLFFIDASRDNPFANANLTR